MKKPPSSHPPWTSFRSIERSSKMMPQFAHDESAVSFFFAFLGRYWRGVIITQLSICKQINWSHLFWIKRFSVRITILNWRISKEIVVTVYIFSSVGQTFWSPPVHSQKTTGPYLVMHGQHGGRNEEEENEPILYRIRMQFYVTQLIP